MDVTVLALTRDMLAMDDDADPMVPLLRAMFDDVFFDPGDPAELMAGYERRLAQVRTEIAPKRLVEWQPADGSGADLPRPPQAGGGASVSPREDHD